MMKKKNGCCCFKTSEDGFVKWGVPLTIIFTSIAFTAVALSLWIRIESSPSRNPYLSVLNHPDSNDFAKVQHRMTLHREGEAVQNVLSDPSEPDVGLVNIIVTGSAWGLFLLYLGYMLFADKDLLSDEVDSLNGTPITFSSFSWFVSGMADAFALGGLLFFAGIYQSSAIYTSALAVFAIHFAKINHPASMKLKMPHLILDVLYLLLGCIPFALGLAALNELNKDNTYWSSYDKIIHLVRAALGVGLGCHIIRMIVSISLTIKSSIIKFEALVSSDSSSSSSSSSKSETSSLEYGCVDQTVFFRFVMIILVLAYTVTMAFVVRYIEVHSKGDSKAMVVSTIHGRPEKPLADAHIGTAITVYFVFQILFYLVFLVRSFIPCGADMDKVSRIPHLDFSRIVLLAISNMFLTLAVGWAGIFSDVFEMVAMICLGLVTDLAWYSWTYFNSTPTSFQGFARFFGLCGQAAMNTAVPAYIIFKVNADTVTVPHHVFYMAVWVSAGRIFITGVQLLISSTTLIGEGTSCSGAEKGHRPCYAKHHILLLLYIIPWIWMVWALHYGDIYKDKSAPVVGAEDPSLCCLEAKKDIEWLYSNLTVVEYSYESCNESLIVLDGNVTDLEEGVEALQTDMEEAQESITDLQEASILNSESIGNLSELLIGQEARLDDQESRLDGHDSEIAQILLEIAILEGHNDTLLLIDQLYANLTLLQSADNDHEARLSALEAYDGIHDLNITDLQSTDATHDSQISVLISADTTHDVRLDDLEATDANHDTNITDLQAADTTHDSRLDALEATDTTHDSQISSLQSADTTHDSRLDALEATDALHDINITDLQAADTTHDSRLDALEAADTTHDSQISSLQSADTTHDSRLDALEATDAIHELNITDFDTRLDTLEAGGSGPSAEDVDDLIEFTNNGVWTFDDTFTEVAFGPCSALKDTRGDSNYNAPLVDPFYHRPLYSCSMSTNQNNIQLSVTTHSLQSWVEIAVVLPRASTSALYWTISQRLFLYASHISTTVPVIKFNTAPTNSENMFFALNAYHHELFLMSIDRRGLYVCLRFQFRRAVTQSNFQWFGLEEPEYTTTFYLRGEAAFTLSGFSINTNPMNPPLQESIGSCGHSISAGGALSATPYMTPFQRFVCAMKLTVTNPIVTITTNLIYSSTSIFEFHFYFDLYADTAKGASTITVSISTATENFAVTRSFQATPNTNFCTGPTLTNMSLLRCQRPDPAKGVSIHYAVFQVDMTAAVSPGSESQYQIRYNLPNWDGTTSAPQYLLTSWELR